MCPGWSWLQLSRRHGPCWELGLGKAADRQAERLGLRVAAGRRWLWIRSTCLDCQRVGGAGTGSCRAEDLVQPLPRLLPSSVALLLCRCCSCLCQGLGLSPAGGQGEPAGSTHMGSLLCPESSELTPCRQAKLRKGLFPFGCSQSFLPFQAWLFLLCWRRQRCLKQHRPLQSLNSTRRSWLALSLSRRPTLPWVFIFGEVTSGKICSGKRLRSTGFMLLPAHRVLRSQGFLFRSPGLGAELSLPTGSPRFCLVSPERSLASGSIPSVYPKAHPCSLHLCLCTCCLPSHSSCPGPVAPPPQMPPYCSTFGLAASTPSSRSASPGRFPSSGTTSSRKTRGSGRPSPSTR